MFHVFHVPGKKSERERERERLTADSETKRFRSSPVAWRHTLKNEIKNEIKMRSRR